MEDLTALQLPIMCALIVLLVATATITAIPLSTAAIAKIGLLGILEAVMRTIPAPVPHRRVL